ncbi:hypothetical protein CcCBS67573_g09238 [Chytriomyces confervae]|uniref:Peptidase M60 domain-containing protein n=1 Tax=Chytriomyces confervae TaxID=246404 RepID=A0A507E120_9FUNG|nr:hypothetical protein CcCBS67573_g09238 [Chytriomyces confervae]
MVHKQPRLAATSWRKNALAAALMAKIPSHVRLRSAVELDAGIPDILSAIAARSAASVTADLARPTSATYKEFVSVADALFDVDADGGRFPTTVTSVAVPLAQSVCITGVQWSEFPIAISDSRRRVCAKLLHALRRDIPLNGTAHPLVQAAAVWPGVPDASVPVTTKTWTLNSKFTKWQSSGLYIFPGSDVKVQFCPGVGVDATSIVGVQIGSTTDTLWDVKDADWERFPATTEYGKYWVKDGAACQYMTIKSLFGGLLFLDTQIAGNLGSITVSGNITPSPLYTGGMSVSDWQKMLDGTVSPFGEMEFEGIILSYPTAILRKSTCASNPAEMKSFYDKLMPEYYKLSGEPLRPYKERINVELQLSVGWMYAGYPIQAHNITDVQELCIHKQSIYETETINPVNNWGYYHELGHNFQKDSWTDYLDQTEVTVNIFSMQMSEIFPFSVHQFGQADFEPNGNARKLEEEWRKKSQPFGNQGTDLFMKLLYYIELRQSFGFEAFRRVFRAYEKLDKQPKTEKEMIDTWAVTFSTTVGYDISPFMTTRWKIPVSDAAAAKTKSLKAFDVGTVFGCGSDSVSFPFGLSPCAEIGVASPTALNFKMSTWATLRRGMSLVIGLEGAGAPALTSTVKVSGKDASLFSMNAVYKKSGTGGAVYLTPTALIPFDTGVTISLEFSAALPTGPLETTFWVENSTDSSLMIASKRKGALSTGNGGKTSSAGHALGFMLYSVYFVLLLSV